MNTTNTYPQLRSVQPPKEEAKAKWLNENSILVGAWAWQGFQEHGRGMVWIRALTMTAEAEPWPWSNEARLLAPTYLTNADAENVIGSLSCEQSRLKIKRALQTYNPSSDAMAWLGSAEESLVLHLHALKVPPEVALRQLVRRRDEFEFT